MHIRLKKIQEKKKIQREKAEREKKSKGIKLGKKLMIILNVKSIIIFIW